MTLRRALVLLSLLLAAAAPACSSRAPTPNLVVIVLDTVRPDFLSVYGHPRPTTPFLERFAAAGTRYDRAYSTSSWTLPAHGSLFTGTLPKVHLANQTHGRVATSLPLLSQELTAAGYETAAFSNNVWVGERSGLDDGFAHYVPLHEGYRGRVEALAGDREGADQPVEDNETVRAVRDWLAARDGERPFFAFVNLVEPHMPYVPTWETAQHFLEAREQRWRAIQSLYPGGREIRLMRRHYLGPDRPDEAELEVARRMYEAELREADRITEALLAAFDAASDPADTLVFVLSDHGENFGEHGHLAHVLNLYDTNLRIPLIARGPGFAAGATSDELVQILDLYPTLLRAAGVEPGPHSIGVDLRGDVPDERELIATLEYPRVSLRMFGKHRESPRITQQHGRELEAVVTPRFKLIRGSDGTEELYDLRADPGETRPLAATDVGADVLARLRSAADREQAAAATAGAAEGEGWDDPEGLEKLRAMGYVE